MTWGTWRGREADSGWHLLLMQAGVLQLRLLQETLTSIFVTPVLRNPQTTTLVLGVAWLRCPRLQMYVEAQHFAAFCPVWPRLGAVKNT